MPPILYNRPFSKLHSIVKATLLDIFFNKFFDNMYGYIRKIFGKTHLKTDQFNNQSELQKNSNETFLVKSRRLKALVVKEFIQIARDPSTILISVFLPLLLLFLYGFGVSLDLDHLKLGLVLEETTPDAIDFAESILDSPYFDVKVAKDRRALLDDLTSGSIRGIVVVPSYFSAFAKRQERIAPIQVISDGSEPNTANFVQFYVEGAYRKFIQQKAITHGGISNGVYPRDFQNSSLVSTVPRFWYNQQLESRFFLLPGSLAITMTLIGTLLTALVVSREWERGTMEALMSTQVSRFELVAGKVIPYFVLGMISMLICVAITVFIFGVPFRGSLWLLILVTALFLFCALGFGLLISTLCRSQLIASQICIAAGFLPAYILSGFLFEISSMPHWIRLLTRVIPAKYFVQSLQTLFLVGNVWGLILLDMISMFVIGLFFFILTAFKTVKRLD